jgi:glycosyltransferase involved in cell wall biosynthesis
VFASIIVPTLNEQAHIVATLNALQQLSGDKEILVVDGGSTDATVSLARSQGVTVLEAPKGRGPQMHAGALEAAGGVLWFVHADTIPPPGALNEINRALEDDEVVGGNFGLLFVDPRALRDSFRPSIRCFDYSVFATEIPEFLYEKMFMSKSAASVPSHFLKTSIFSGDCGAPEDLCIRLARL